MKISRAAGYAVTAVSQLSDDPKTPPIPCSELALAGDMPERFLLQLMRYLVSAEICVSTRGVDGGYRLARPAAQINLAQIIEAIDGPINAGEMERLDGLTFASNQLVSRTIKDANKELRHRLAAVPLSSLKAIAPKPVAAT